MAAVTLHPIGTFHCNARYPYDAPRQPMREGCINTGIVQLDSGRGFEQALDDLAGFSHLWLIFLFDRNANWTPKVLPPRGLHNVGVFSTRAPYRPNPIGMSCVRLDRIDALNLHISEHDLLDGTPILDIKPYIPTDIVDNIRYGWLENAEKLNAYAVEFDSMALEKMAFLESREGPPCLRMFLHEQLAVNPLRNNRKRLTSEPDGTHVIAYRTWRIRFRIDESARTVHVADLFSGYVETELRDPADPYLDKQIHRVFQTFFAT